MPGARSSFPACMLTCSTRLCFSANAGTWREALGCSFAHLGTKSSEKGSVQVDSSVLHLSLQPRRAERSRLVAAAPREEARVWDLDLGAGLCHRFCSCSLMMQAGLMTRALLTHTVMISDSDVGIGG